MNIIFRTDASVQIGIGHVMRCLTLADALRARGAECRFICREHEGHLLEQIRQRGFDAYGLPVCSEGVACSDPAHEEEPSQSAWLGTDWATDAAQTKVGAGEKSIDWLIVDHYALDARWEMAIRPICRRLMVIDDLADRPHDCDLLLDQNYYRDQGQRYQGLLSEGCVTLLGLGYTLLRPEFVEARRRPRSRDGSVKRILIFFGGSDPTNQTEKVLSALAQLKQKDIAVDVVIGSANPNRNAIQVLCSQLPVAAFHCQISNMAELILNADLGIGAGGSAMWERCYLGLPTITVVLADNQVRTTEDVADIGAIAYLGRSDPLTPADYARAIVEMIDNPSRVKAIAAAALGMLQAARISVTDVMCKVIQQDAPAGPI